MLEYLGLEVPWALCLSYPELAVEPGYRLFTAAKVSYYMYYLDGMVIWCQNQLSGACTDPLPSLPLAICYMSNNLHVLLSDGLRYILDKDGYPGLTLHGSAFVDLHHFYD